jgi:hypothetical protein
MRAQYLYERLWDAQCSPAAIGLGFGEYEFSLSSSESFSADALQSLANR